MRSRVFGFVIGSSALLLSSIAAVGLMACGPTGEGEGEGEGEGPQGPATCTVGETEFLKPLAHATLEDGSAPNFSCVANPETLAAGQNVTLEGCVDIFGIGGKAKPGLKIAFFDVSQDPTSGDTVPAYGETDIAVKAQEGPLQAEAAECSKEGFYRIENIPTNKPLNIKVYDTDEGFAQTAIPTYSWFVYMEDEKVVDGVLDYEANLVYKTTYDSIPTLGGKRVDGQQVIYDGEGRGVIAGEIHDCDGQLVKDAAVTTSRFDNDTKMAFFNGDTEDPTPDPALSATNTDALYAVLNAATDPGANDHDILTAILDPACEAADPLECDCVSAGSALIRVFPDSVSIVSPEGTFAVAAN
jgi:hypothetical protein